MSDDYLKSPQLEYVACDLCGLDVVATLLHGRDRLFGGEETFQIVQCQQCGLVYLNPRPKVTEMYRYYPSDEYYAYGNVLSGQGHWLRFKQMIKRIILEEYKGYPLAAKLVPEKNSAKVFHVFRKALVFPLKSRFWTIPPCKKGGRILDIGCGSGSYLRVVQELGWEAHGVEVDRKATNYAREKLGLDVFPGQLEEARFPDGYFDVVNMWHVLEHLPHPTRSLVEVRRILKIGGTLMIEVPSLRSPQALLFQDKWFHLDVPRHLYVFTPPNAARDSTEGRFLYGCHLSCPHH